MKYIVIVFLLICYTGFSQTEFAIQNISYSDKMEFPYVLGESTAVETLNHNLTDYLSHSLCVEDFDTITDCIKKAIVNGLDSLSYLYMQTDTTISFLYTTIRSTGSRNFFYKDYYTYSKNTGKRMWIKELFPDEYTIECEGILRDIWSERIMSINSKLYSAYQSELISEFEFMSLNYYLDHKWWPPFRDFLVYDDCFILPLEEGIPVELRKHIPQYIRICFSDILIRLDWE